MNDQETRLIGYQVDFDEIGLGFFLFNHLDCGTTMSFKVQSFMDLYDGPLYSAPLQNTGRCPEYCIYEEDLRSCEEECECASVRGIIQVINQWPKQDPR